MSKKSYVRRQFGREHNKWVKTLFQSERQHMTYDDKHYLLNRDNLTQPIQMQLSHTQKNFRQFFFCIFKIDIKF